MEVNVSTASSVFARKFLDRMKASGSGKEPKQQAQQQQTQQQQLLTRQGEQGKRRAGTRQAENARASEGNNQQHNAVERGVGRTHRLGLGAKPSRAQQTSHASALTKSIKKGLRKARQSGELSEEEDLEDVVSDSDDEGVSSAKGRKGKAVTLSHKAASTPVPIVAVESRTPAPPTPAIASKAHLDPLEQIYEERKAKKEKLAATRKRKRQAKKRRAQEKRQQQQQQQQQQQAFSRPLHHQQMQPQQQPRQRSGGMVDPFSSTPNVLTQQQQPMMIPPANASDIWGSGDIPFGFDPAQRRDSRSSYGDSIYGSQELPTDQRQARHSFPLTNPYDAAAIAFHQAGQQQQQQQQQQPQQVASPLHQQQQPQQHFVAVPSTSTPATTAVTSSVASLYHGHHHHQHHQLQHHHSNTSTYTEEDDDDDDLFSKICYDVAETSIRDT